MLKKLAIISIAILLSGCVNTHNIQEPLNDNVYIEPINDSFLFGELNDDLQENIGNNASDIHKMLDIDTITDKWIDVIK